MNKLVYLLLLPLASASHTRTSSSSTAVNWPASPTLTSASASLRPVRWSLVGDRARKLTVGRAVPITVQADIAKGWHIYSLNQKPGGPIPLRIQLLGATDVIIRGVIDAPKPERLFDNNFGIETELYSGSPRFTIPVGVPGRAGTGTRKIQVAARYQVCSDKLCLPPRTDSVGVTLRLTRP
jgi:DsbC/DsbD-like thiol-disulfide interchange protein